MAFPCHNSRTPPVMTPPLMGDPNGVHGQPPPGRSAPGGRRGSSGDKSLPDTAGGAFAPCPENSPMLRPLSTPNCGFARNRRPLYEAFLRGTKPKKAKRNCQATSSPRCLSLPCRLFLEKCAANRLDFLGNCTVDDTRPTLGLPDTLENLLPTMRRDRLVCLSVCRRNTQELRLVQVLRQSKIHLETIFQKSDPGYVECEHFPHC